MKKIIALGLLIVTVTAFAEDKCCWIDAKTGKEVPRSQLLPEGAEFNDAEHNHASISGPISGTFANFVRGSDNSWINAKTGKEVPCSQLLPEGAKFDDAEHNHASISGPISGTFANFVRVPCPEEASSTTTPPPGGGVKTASAPALFNVGLGYSYMHADAEEVQNLNGFAVSGFYNVNSWLAFGGEFSGLYGTETQNYTDGSVKTSLDRYLYLFGPQVTFHPCNRTTIYGRVLAGGVHDCNDVTFPGGSYYSTGNAFAMAAGAGVDVRVTRHFSIGPSFDYVPTHFISPNGNNWQNNWRVGLTAKFSF